MEWLTQSLPDVRDSEKPRMGSNDLAPCLLHSQHHRPRFIYFFFAPCAANTHIEHNPRLVRRREENEKNARSTSLALLGLFHCCSTEQFCDERAENWRSLAIADAHQSLSLTLRLMPLPPRCNYLRRILFKSLLSRAPCREMLRADAHRRFSQEFSCFSE
jgi:hypothetical protein